MAVADLTVSATNDGPWVAGGTGTYTLVVTASAGHAQSDKLVSLTHLLPAGLSADSAEGEGWSCSVSGHEISCISHRTVAAGASFPPVTIKVAIDRLVAGEVSARTALSVAGAEADTTNNTTTSTTTVAAL